MEYQVSKASFKILSLTGKTTENNCNIFSLDALLIFTFGCELFVLKMLSAKDFKLFRTTPKMIPPVLYR